MRIMLWIVTTSHWASRRHWARLPVTKLMLRVLLLLLLWRRRSHWTVLLLLLLLLAELVLKELLMRWQLLPAKLMGFVAKSIILARSIRFMPIVMPMLHLSLHMVWHETVVRVLVAIELLLLLLLLLLESTATMHIFFFLLIS